jgi:hypothetical protein
LKVILYKSKEITEDFYWIEFKLTETKFPLKNSHGISDKPSIKEKSTIRNVKYLSLDRKYNYF